jgi:3-hydroxy acid dehydrogenase/malonic semialdehyde reductase
MDKIIMITGATAGFGWATALKFAQNGYNTIITGRRKERLDELEKKLNTSGNIKVLPLNFDVRNNDEVKSVIGNLPEEWKNIDILINNAGLAVGLDPLPTGNTDDWDRMVDTNIKGLLYVTRAVAPLMITRGKGHIFNIGSIAGKGAYEGGNVYCSTKAAVDSLTKSMRIDMLKHNIRVTQIAPGMAETEFSIVRFKGDTERAKSVYRGFEALTGDDIADAIYYCASLPANVCINDLVITPTRQADVHFNYRKE